MMMMMSDPQKKNYEYMYQTLYFSQQYKASKEEK
jgi:hypothetical protein